MNPNVMPRLFKAFSGLLLLISLSSPGFALPEDQGKIMEFSADSADLNASTHLGEYVGNVEFNQGSSHLQASRAITKGNQKNKLVVAIAEGDAKDQAHYWTLTAADKPLFHAWADVIRYYPKRHLIELIGNARVEQGSDSFSAPQISYDTVKQHILSESDGKSGTTIIIHPGKKA